MKSSVAVISCLLTVSFSAALLTNPPITVTQYHSQDELGQYGYGYSGGPSAKEETKTADGVTRGRYSYIDANGIIQSVSYVSDPVHGFRVSATNLPAAPAPLAPVTSGASGSPVSSAAKGFDYVNGVSLETSEIAAARAAHFAAHNEALARLARRWKRSLVAPVFGKPHSVVARPIRTTRKSFPYSASAPSPSVVGYSFPSARPFSYSASAPPVTTMVVSDPVDGSFSYSTVETATPVFTAYSAPTFAPEIPLSFQYQTRNDLGEYSYGYSKGLSSKTESPTLDGVTHGGYSYLDAKGILQSVKYVADAAGFRVRATNLPLSTIA